MSKLEELIAELCPDGVEYKTLSQVLTIKNGSDYKGGELPERVEKVHLFSRNTIQRL